MAFWSGFAKGLQEYNVRETEDRRIEEDRKFQKDMLWERVRAERENAVFESLLSRGAIFGGTSSGGSTGKGATATTSPSHAVNVLVNRYNVPESAIERIAADGNPSSLGQAVEILDNASKKYREIYGEDLPQEVISGMFENAIVTQPSEVEINWDEVSKYLGGDIPPEFRDMVGGSFSQPGATSFEEPVIRKKYSMEEISKARELAGSQVQALNTDAIQNYQNRLNELSNIMQDSSVGEETRSRATALSIEIGDALAVATAAQQAAEKGNYLPLIKLYGNEAMSFLKEYYPQLAEAPLGIEFNQ